jgi:hypothetical protein
MKFDGLGEKLLLFFFLACSTRENKFHQTSPKQISIKRDHNLKKKGEKNGGIGLERQNYDGGSVFSSLLLSNNCWTCKQISHHRFM